VCDALENVPAAQILDLFDVFSMIEMMENYTEKLEERLERLERQTSNPSDGKLVPDAIVLDNPPVDDMASFTNCRMAVMIVCVEPTTEEPENDLGLVANVREMATSVIMEVIVEVEGSNSIVVAVAAKSPDELQSTVSPVAHLLVLAKHINEMVRIHNSL